MPWLKIALVLLQLADKFADIARANQLLSVGEDRQIAKSSLAILKKTQAAKEIDANVERLSDSDVIKSLAASGGLRD